MHRSKEVRDLVKALKVAPANLTPYILDFLNEYEDDGYLKMMMEADVVHRIEDILEESGERSKRKAVKLLLKFVAWGKGEKFLTERNTTHMVRMLHGADLDLRNWITYCLPESISSGNAPIVSIEDGIPELVDQLDTMDDNLICCTVMALIEMEKAGYQQEIIRHQSVEKLKKLKSSSDRYVSSYSDQLYKNLTGWTDSSSRVGNVLAKPRTDVQVIKQVAIRNTKEETLERHPGEEKYVRPKLRDPKKRKTRKGALSSNGRKTPEGDEETILEIPSKSTKTLKERMGKDKEEEFEISA
jgi:hypothetical protein